MLRVVYLMARWRTAKIIGSDDLDAIDDVPTVSKALYFSLAREIAERVVDFFGRGLDSTFADRLLQLLNGPIATLRKQADNRMQNVASPWGRNRSNQFCDFSENSFLGIQREFPD